MWIFSNFTLKCNICSIYPFESLRSLTILISVKWYQGRRDDGAADEERPKSNQDLGEGAVE